MTKSIFFTSAALAAVAAGTTSASAQQASGPAAITSAGPSAAPEVNSDIIVTARRREERLQDVPLAITAVTAQAIADAGARDLRSIIALTPGVTLDGNSAESNQVPVIRGEYNLNNAPGSGGQPNVAVFADGIYIQNSSAISLGLLDLQRVEIIKGPVSALYGRNGFAGAINYVSKKPTDDVHADATFQAGSYGDFLATGDVNGPIVKGILRMGLAGNFQSFDGGYRDDVTGLRAGAFKKRDGKVTLDFTPTSKLEITAGFYYGNDHFGQTPNVFALNNCAGGTAVCGEYTAQPIEIANIPASSGNSGNTRKVEAGNLHINYDLDFAVLSYLGGFNHVTERSYEDFSGLRNGLPFNLAPGPGTFNVYELFGADNNTRDNSQELRLTSNQKGHIRWSFGGDYFNSTVDSTTLIGLDGAQIPPGQSVSQPSNYFLSGFFVTPDGSASTSNFTQAVTGETTYSAFGSLDVDILQNLTASGEVRYTHDHQQLYILHNAFIANTTDPYGSVGPISSHFTNYRGSLRYKPSTDLNFYASVASGTKAGGYNGRATIPSELSYAPEKNTTYEIGVKADFLNRMLGLEVALYHIDTSNLQINTISDDPQNFGQVVKNFGGTRNTGLEIAAHAQPVRDFGVSASLAYTDPKFTSSTTDVNGVSVCSLVASCAGRIVSITTVRGPMNAVDLGGLMLQRASKFQVNIAADYKHQLQDGYDIFAHIDYRLETKQYSGLEDLYYVGDRNLVNIRVGAGKGPAALALVVRNATNNRTPVYPTQNTQLNNFSNIFVANLPEPRIISAELTLRF